ncbi:MAG: STM3941 family protein [Crocinitomicaceae bacterium]
MGDNNTEYHYKKTGTVGMIIASVIIIIVFISCSILLLTIKDQMPVPLLVLVFVIQIIALREIIPRTIFLIFNALKNKPAIKLTEELLIDNVNRKRIKWIDIEEIGGLNISRGNMYIPIEITNRQEYLNNEKSWFNRAIMRLNSRFFKGSFAIHPNPLVCDNNELLLNLQNYHKNAKRRNAAMKSKST